MVRRIFLLSLLGLLLPVAAGAQFIIVTRTGAQIAARSQPQFDKNMVRFQSMRGTQLVMNVVNLDVDETERINGIELPVKVRSLAVVPAAEMGTAPQYGWEVPQGARASAEETYTNAKLRALRTRRIFVESGSSLPEDVGAAAANQRSDLEPLDAGNKAEWQTRSQAIHNRQKELDRRRSLLRSEAQRLQRGMAGQDASATQRLGKELDRTNTELQTVERELSQLSKEWENLQQEARRAGVPDSWIQ